MIKTLEHKKKWFQLFSNCIIVRGNKASIICDLGRHTHYPIPNEFASLIQELQSVSIEDFLNDTDYERDDIERFMSQFINEEVAFITTEPKVFPRLSLDYRSSAVITNAILQIDSNTDYDVEALVNQLSALGCQAIQLRFENTISIEDLKNYLELFDASRISCIDILLPFQAEATKDQFYNLISTYPRIRKILNYDSPHDNIVLSDDILYNGRLRYTKDQLKTSKAITKDDLLFNLKLFSEAQQHNLGLNKKVCITSNGSIKNYLDHQEDFGNVKTIALLDIVNSEAFTKKWHVSNNAIEKCKDCQFRYCCESNSDIYKKGNLYHKTSMCTFNPYTNTWNTNA